VTLGSGLDAITQLIEPWLCTRANPFTDALCRAAIPRGIKALRTLMEKECPDSRDEMAWSACAAAWRWPMPVLASFMDWLARWGLSNASHGALCGSLLPYGLALNESQVSNRAIRGRLKSASGWPTG
jgi:alcohol dehydrogenase class IV